MKIELEEITDAEPDEEIEKLLDYMSHLSQLADTCEWWIT